MAKEASDITLSRDGYIFGFDPPSTANFGYCVFKYNHEDKTVEYVESGTNNINGSSGEQARIMNLVAFMNSLMEKYDPVAYVMERSIGRGFAVARENISENTGIIKFIGYHSGAEVLAIHTNRMVHALFQDEEISKMVSGTRAKKKEILCKAIKLMFPDFLANRKVSKSGQFTHEADAITFCVSFSRMMGLKIINMNDQWMLDEALSIEMQDLLEAYRKRVAKRKPRVRKVRGKKEAKVSVENTVPEDN